MPSYNNRNIVLHELIGLNVEVINCSDPDQIGIVGRVIDETKNTLLIATEKGTRRAIKKCSTFRFSKGSKSFIVDGEEINFRPYERIEKSLKFYKKRKI
jgi:ribonuclease P protein subunit POP4